MRRLLVIALALCAVSAGAEKGFKPLFNGKTLDGWDGDPQLWKVQNGVIVGSTEGVTLKGNTFLISKQSYRDFVLKLEVKLRNHNSGVQFRSQALPNWVVAGYQADMAEGNYWGSIYDERGQRGMLADGWEKAKPVLKAQDWNEYEILCNGDHIQVKLNGVVTADIHDTARTEGIIALQLHQGPAMEAYFRNIRIKVLK
jgi:Domain of Unknown Function (DUF1080)